MKHETKWGLKMTFNFMINRFTQIYLSRVIWFATPILWFWNRANKWLQALFSGECSIIKWIYMVSIPRIYEWIIPWIIRFLGSNLGREFHSCRTKKSRKLFRSRSTGLRVQSMHVHWSDGTLCQWQLCVALITEFCDWNSPKRKIRACQTSN